MAEAAPGMIGGYGHFRICLDDMQRLVEKGDLEVSYPIACTLRQRNDPCPGFGPVLE